MSKTVQTFQTFQTTYEYRDELTIQDLVDKLRSMRTYSSKIKKSNYHDDLKYSIYHSDHMFCNQYIPPLPIDDGLEDLDTLIPIKRSNSRCENEYSHRPYIPEQKKKILRSWYVRNSKIIPQYLDF